MDEDDLAKLGFVLPSDDTESKVDKCPPSEPPAKRVKLENITYHQQPESSDSSRRKNESSHRKSNDDHLSEFHRAFNMMGSGDEYEGRSSQRHEKEKTTSTLTDENEDDDDDDDKSKVFTSVQRDDTTSSPTSTGKLQPMPIAGEENEQSTLEDDEKVGTSHGDELHNGNVAEEERLRMQLLVSNFSKDQLSRYEMYRRSVLPKGAIRKIVQQTAGCIVSPNVIIAISGISKVFAGEVIEEALNVRDRMKEGKDAVKPKHIREALRRITEKGGPCSLVNVKRKPYYS